MGMPEIATEYRLVEYPTSMYEQPVEDLLAQSRQEPDPTMAARLSLAGYDRSTCPLIREKLDDQTVIGRLAARYTVNASRIGLSDAGVAFWTDRAEENLMADDTHTKRIREIVLLEAGRIMALRSAQAAVRGEPNPELARAATTYFKRVKGLLHEEHDPGEHWDRNAARHAHLSGVHEVMKGRAVPASVIAAGGIWTAWRASKGVETTPEEHRHEIINEVGLNAAVLALAASLGIADRSRRVNAIHGDAALRILGRPSSDL